MNAAAPACVDPYAEEFHEPLSVRVLSPSQIDYSFDWSNRLPDGAGFAGTPIVTPTGVVVEGVDVVDGTIIRAWLSADPTAVVGSTATLDYEIDDTDGRKEYARRIVRYTD